MCLEASRSSFRQAEAGQQRSSPRPHRGRRAHRAPRQLFLSDFQCPEAVGEPVGHHHVALPSLQGQGGGGATCGRQRALGGAEAAAAPRPGRPGGRPPLQRHRRPAVARQRGAADGRGAGGAEAKCHHGLEEKAWETLMISYDLFSG